MPSLPVTVYNDPGCPFGYSAAPDFARLRWRFGDALEWRLVMIGLAETSSQYEDRGYTPLDMAKGVRRFRRYGMPIAPIPKAYVAPTTRACRAVVATRMMHPGREWAAMRAIQLMHFTTDRMLDDDVALEDALATVPGIDAPAVTGAIDDPDVVEEYEKDRAESRTAAGTAAEAQGKAATTDGPVRFTAPSVMFDERWMVGGFQPYGAYDVVLANIDPELPRRDAPEDAAEALEAFPDGLTTAEIAAVMTPGVGEADIGRAEDALLEAMARGDLRRLGAGDDALWLPARSLQVQVVG
jgi:2-hydroxychromene-2-carboxylate isomerase